MSTDASAEESVCRAQSISEAVLSQHAGNVDAANRFPKEGIDSLRDAGLLACMIPARFGGRQCGFRQFWRIAAALGEACPSTAFIWTQHTQQLLVLSEHGGDEISDVLRDIAKHGPLVGSVTSEFAKGGDLLTAHAPLMAEGGKFRVRRAAPIVSYGEEAAFFLISMRAGEDRPAKDVNLVLATHDDGAITVTGGWDAMGMRGTRSVPMDFDVVVDSSRIVGKSFRELAMKSMIPAGHIGWAACWFGAARGAFNRVVRKARTPAGRKAWNLDSDIFLGRLAKLRLALDITEALLDRAADTMDKLLKDKAPLQRYENATHNIMLNNVKVVSSTLSFSVVDGLIELAGMAQGYLKNRDLGLERVFRDLRAASLLFHNDRLDAATGKLVLFEHATLGDTWANIGRISRSGQTHSSGGLNHSHYGKPDEPPVFSGGTVAESSITGTAIEPDDIFK